MIVLSRQSATQIPRSHDHSADWILQLHLLLAAFYPPLSLTLSPELETYAVCVSKRLENMCHCLMQVENRFLNMHDIFQVQDIVRDQS